MRIRNVLLCLWLMWNCAQMASAQSFLQTDVPKREFRGAWIQTVNGQFKGESSAEMRQNLLHQLDALQKAGINVVIFQIRPEADCFYQSNIEPWSRFLTGTQGVAPDNGWDPLQFMVDECHRRGMELHAWINPYRVKTNNSVELCSSHIYHQHPEWFVVYGNQLFFNPALPQSREHICKVVRDVVSRYDVDAIHMDDYFYPYPLPGVEFPDSTDFQTYGKRFANKGDWRRDNVNQLIRELHNTIRETKPWVKFGISPFGIYRNEKNDAHGSKTNGLQNYDDLYADVLLWAKKGWIDYLMPQVYWHIGHPAADYETLVKWWAKHNGNRPVIIGQSVMNTIQHTDPMDSEMNQLPRKMDLQRRYQSIVGSCQWPASAVIENKGNYADALKKIYHRYQALPPVFDFIDHKAPKKVSHIKPIWTEDGYILFWTAPKYKHEMDRAVKYVIYRFDKNEKMDIGSAQHIVAVTGNTFYKLPYDNGKTKYRYVVTAVDRLENESKGVSKKIKL